MQNGHFAFPRMEQMELQYQVGTFGYNPVPSRNSLLQTVRIRAEEPTTQRIGHLRIPNWLASARFRKELEQYVPSLVVFD